MKRLLQFSVRSTLFILLLYSCSEWHGCETAFDRVVAYYQASGDSLKLKAAEYLKTSAKYHYGIHYDIPRDIDPTPFLEVYFGDSVFKHYLDSCGYHVSVGNPVFDIDTISEDFLIDNIELAFDSWQQPWAKYVSFDDFCKYILPYRNANEELSDWRRHFKEWIEPTIIDSVSDPTDIRAVASYILRYLQKEIEYGGSTGAFCRELLTPKDIERLHWANCNNCAHYLTLALRACGVPCAQMLINWRFTEVAHSSVLIPAIGNNERAFRITIGDTLMYMGASKDTMACWRVWSYAYEANPELLNLYERYKRDGGTQQILRNFAMPVTREDVTSSFCKTFDFTLSLPDTLRKKTLVFLCRFYKWKWLPIREGYVKGDSVYFKNATIRQWYRLGYMDGDSIRTVGTPFTIVGDSNIKRVNERIRPYNLTGDTVLFKMVYPCDAGETRLTRTITTYYWDNTNRWHPYTGEARLWGFNAKTNEYRLFNETLRKSFKPVFHLLELRLPCWTVFTDDETDRPLGYLQTDNETGEGRFMQF